MPAPNAFEYATIRVVPRVEREEFVNVGVILFCRPRRFLDARIFVDPARIHTLWPALDLPEVQRQLAFIPLVCAGGEQAGPIGQLPQFERFRWLAAPRSTVIQPSPVHCGFSADPLRELEALFVTMVLPLRADASDDAPALND